MIIFFLILTTLIDQLCDKSIYRPYLRLMTDGISSDSAGNIFNERGISVRTGLECAPIAHQYMGTYPAGTIRFSISYFTTEEDFEELIAALDDIEESM